MILIEAFVREVFPENENPTSNISHLRVWGCDTFVLIPKKKRQKNEKFKNRSRQGKLVGYKAQNIYKMYILDTRKVEKHRDVVFDEDID
jgi:GTPase SAR1 family protein